MTTPAPIQLLLAVSGISPQVITETLYGIAMRLELGQDARWPEQIRIVTTYAGKLQITRALIDDGWLEKVCNEVSQPVITLGDSDVLVVSGAEGKPVVDARSSDDHEALADFITTTVRDLTAERNHDNTEKYQLHVSIAGGRKTMTFYLGYAISLFGRHFDQMSHVLISEGFEGAPDFYFPTSEPCPVSSGHRILCASKARVTLADIPFIRIRHSLPELLTRLGEQINYRQLVSLINLGDQPENVRLLVDTQAMSIHVFSRCFETPAVSKISIPNPVYMAFYLLFVEDTRRSADEREIHSRPTKDNESTLMSILLIRLESLLGSKSQATSNAELCAHLIEEHGLAYCNLERTLNPLVEKGVLDKNRFNNYLTNIRETFEKALPDNLISLLLPSPLFDQKNGDYCHKTNRSGGYGYGLKLQPYQIRIN